MFRIGRGPILHSGRSTGSMRSDSSVPDQSDFGEHERWSSGTLTQRRAVAEDRSTASWQGWRSWPDGRGQPPVRRRRVVGFALRRPLARSAGTVRQVEDGPHPFRALGQGRRLRERVFEALIKDRKNQYLMLDTTLVRAHQQAATGKGGTRTRLWGAPEED